MSESSPVLSAATIASVKDYGYVCTDVRQRLFARYREVLEQHVSSRRRPAPEFRREPCSIRDMAVREGRL